MAIGKLNYSYHLTPSSNQPEPMDSQTDTLIAQDAQHQSAGRSAPKVCLTARHSKMIHVATIASKMEAGNKEFTHVFIEI